jgi:hypothetical protein
MARYVVLEFDDNDDANSFVEEMLQDHEGVVGVYAKPTLFCPAGGCSTGRIKSFVQGVNLGWWVCSNCKKPSRAVEGDEQLMRSVIDSAINLLPGSETQAADVFTRGWSVANRD